MKLPDKLFSKKIKIGLGVLIAVGILCVVGFFALAQLASRGAAFIFNKEMEKQDMLRGTITVDSIMGHVTGDVNFENLVWKEPDGDLILQVPEGSFHVRPWDVVTRSFKSTTVQKITLKNAVFSVRFDEDMNVDFLKQKKTESAQPKGETKQQEKTEVNSQERKKNVSAMPEGESEWEEEMEWQEDTEEIGVADDNDGSNFNRNGRKLRGEIVLEDCRLEARYKKRHYVLNNVNMNLALNTSGKSHIDLSTGKFGGTMRGGGMSIFGDIDFKQATPVADVDVSLRDVDPSSLGFGMKLYDLMTVVARIEGPITGPTGRGSVKMKELHIPALDFTDIIGDVYYSNAKFRFSDVRAKVYGGTLVARGDYNLDTRQYHIYGNGKDLDSKQALRDLRFSCLVDLNINLECDGNPRNTLAYGDFKSGKGHYSFFPFDSLQGRFSNQFKELSIYDARIISPFGTISTDAIYIKKGKLYLGKILLRDQDTGEAITLREDKNKDNNKEARDSKGNKDAQGKKN